MNTSLPQVIWSAREGNTDLCRLLLDRGASVNEQEDDKVGFGRTPLLSAVMRGHVDTVTSHES